MPDSGSAFLRLPDYFIESLFGGIGNPSEDIRMTGPMFRRIVSGRLAISIFAKPVHIDCCHVPTWGCWRIQSDLDEGTVHGEWLYKACRGTECSLLWRNTILKN